MLVICFTIHWFILALFSHLVWEGWKYRSNIETNLHPMVVSGGDFFLSTSVRHGSMLPNPKNDWFDNVFFFNFSKFTNHKKKSHFNVMPLDACFVFHSLTFRKI